MSPLQKTAKTRVAITGASGFIGRSLCARLIADGHPVVALSRQASPQNLPDGVDVRQTDYTYATLGSALKNVDVLIHLAARRSTREDDPHAVAPFLQSMSGLLDPILRAAHDAGVQRFVNGSSIAVYSPRNPAPYREDVPPAPLNGYGLAKLAQEHAIDIWSNRTNTPALHIRLAACYGFGEKLTPALMRFAVQAARGERLNISGSGHYRIDQIYIDDAVEAFAKAVTCTTAGAVNIGGGTAHRVREIAEMANRVFENRQPLHVEHPDAPDMEAHLRVMSIARAKTHLDWAPKFSLAKGLGQMRKAMLSHRETPHPDAAPQ